MFTSNPFAELSAYISPGVMQTFVILMLVLVVAGTLFDIIHKKSAKYFFDNWEKSKSKSTQSVSVAPLAVGTLASEVLTSSEFCNPIRRIAHLLGMYGFVAFVVATAVLVFKFPTSASAGIWPLVWHIAALMVCVGGYWFWFFIRADVSAEGHSSFRIIKADLFILSLLASATFALLWSWQQGTPIGWLFFALFILATLVLFGGIPWSKFAHMFFKPAAALQKRVEEADGSNSNLPMPADKPATFGKTKMPARNY